MSFPSEQGHRVIRYQNRHDGSYVVWWKDPYIKGKGQFIGVVRKLSPTRWIAVTPGEPPEAAERGTRRTAAAWLVGVHGESK